MITASRLTLLTNMPVGMLTTAIQEAGYKKDHFTSATFVGITNAGQFCYRCTYIEDNQEHRVKVFLTYNPTKDQVTADY